MKRFVAILWAGFLLLAAVCCVYQFGIDQFAPFGVAAVILCIVWLYRPVFRAACWFIGGLAALLFIVDATVLQHRLAVEFRSWSLVWDCEDVVDTLRSPSGRSTAYIVGGGFLDSAYWAYISDGGLFPKHTYIDMDATDAYYPKDFSAAWSGSVFSVAGVHYDETTRQLSSSKP